MSDFYGYFKENMDSLGLPAPDSLFGTLQATLGNVAIFLAHIDKFGKAVTVGEVIGAATTLERLGVIATLSASFYVGAVVGSIAVASGRSLAGGTSIADVMVTAHKYQIDRAWLVALLRSRPALYDRKRPHRKHLRHHHVIA